MVKKSPPTKRARASASSPNVAANARDALLATALTKIKSCRGQWFDPRPIDPTEREALLALRPLPESYLGFLDRFGAAKSIEVSFPWFGMVHFLPARVILRDHAALMAAKLWPPGAIQIAAQWDPPDACLGLRYLLDANDAIVVWDPRSGAVRVEHRNFDEMLGYFLRSVGRASYDGTYGFSL